MRNTQAHYIKENEQSRVPKRLVVFDTEAEIHRNDNREVQTWSLGVARFIYWTNEGNIRTSQSRFETSLDLWSAISSFTRPRQRTVIYCHNVSYDLRISSAIQCLSQLGWSLSDIRMDSRGSWSRWCREGTFMSLCDSASIWACPLATLGVALRLPKPRLPDWTDREKLFQRCEADTEILATALVEYFGWLRSGVAGNWQMTGAGQSWAHFRHSHYTHKILVHDNQDALDAERRAMWTGRAEAWQWGRIFGRRLYDYDWENSYPRIARDVSVPTAYRGTVTVRDTARMESLFARYAVLADIEVVTDTPSVPCSAGDRIIWPVGTFQTTLWDPEIRLLLRDGVSFRVRRAWIYRKQPALRQWSEWILGELHDRTGRVPEWQKIVLKHWSRALIGRFAMRYRSWHKFAESDRDAVSLQQCSGDLFPDATQLLQVGRDVFVDGPLSEVNDGCPQITGYIQSEARAKLWRVTQAVGSRGILYVDTDSILVDGDGHRRLQAMQGNSDVAGLRVKRVFNGAEIYGPRSIVLDGQPRIAGMPKRAKRLENGDFYGEAWQSLTRAIETGCADRVNISGRSFRVLWQDGRRERMPDGSTRPYRMGLDSDYNTRNNTTRSVRREQLSALNTIRRSKPLAAIGRGNNHDGTPVPSPVRLVQLELEVNPDGP